MNKRIFWKKIKKRGPLVWDNVHSQSTLAGELPATYYVASNPDGSVDYHESVSALQSCGSKTDPHLFRYVVFDEDEGVCDYWELVYIRRPLRWQTEKEFLKKAKVEKCR